MQSCRPEILSPGYYFSFSEGINIILIGNIDTKFHEIDLILAFDFTSFFGLDFLKIFWPIVQRLIWFLYILKLDKWSITFYCVFMTPKGKIKSACHSFLYWWYCRACCYFTRFLNSFLCCKNACFQLTTTMLHHSVSS